MMNYLKKEKIDPFFNYLILVTVLFFNFTENQINLYGKIFKNSLEEF